VSGIEKNSGVSPLSRRTHPEYGGIGDLIEKRERDRCKLYALLGGRLSPKLRRLESQAQKSSGDGFEFGRSDR